MGKPRLLLCFLLVVSFTLASQLSVWREQSPSRAHHSGSMLEVLMGDSRRLLASHLFTKADVYMHRGVYPSIFSQARRQAERSHLANAASASSYLAARP